MIQIKRILCPIDFSEYSEHALRYAMKMARWYDASLQVLHVMPPMGPIGSSALAATGYQLVRNNLKNTIERWQDPEVDVAAELVESASTTEMIMRRADALDVDLIVAGSHGRRGVRRMLLGSVMEPLLHRCGQPVLVVPAGLNQSSLERPVAFSRIICGVDFSEASLTALAYALSIAEECDAQLTMVNAIEMPPELINPPQPPDFNIEAARGEVEAERLTKLRALIPEHARDYCTVETAVVEGGASRQLLRLAGERQADLVVLGVHGRKALDLAVFGSNAKDVVTRAHCPVLIVPAGPRRQRVDAPLRIRHAEPAFVE
jgi:nucleotide-binding universal stress UspA family protein